MITNRLAQRGENPEWLKWVIAVTVSFAALMQVIDVSIVNVSLPQMQGNLGATVTEIGWVITGYAVANAIVIPLTAWLGDYFGSKAFFIFSLAAFTAASMFCGFATTLPMLIFARVLQGFFGGGLAPRAQAILFETFPAQQQGLAQAVFGLGVIVGPTFAPTLGGYITDTLGWRWVFFINLPLGILTVLMSALFLKPSGKRAPDVKRIDLWGILLLALWLGCFQTFLEEGQADGWFESSFIIALAVIAIVGFGLFVWRELKSSRPAVDLRVLRHKALVGGSLFAVVLGLSLYGTIFVIPLFTQIVLGFTAVQTGTLIIPGALMTALCLPFVGRMIGKVDTRIIIGTGSILIAMSMFMLAGININSNWNSLFWPLLVRGIGMGGMFVPLSVATLGTIPKRELGMASGFFNLMRQIGGSVGVAVLATMLSKRQEFHFDRLRESVSTFSNTAQYYYQQAQQMLVFKGFDVTSAKQGALSLLERITQLHSMILAFQDAYIFVGVMFIVSLPVIWLLASGAHTRNAHGKA